MHVLVLNSGSSSLKFQIIATDVDAIRAGKDDRLCRGEIDGIGAEATIKIQYRNDPPKNFSARVSDVGAALDWLVEFITSESSGIVEIHGVADVDAIGHRVVHGGERFKESVLIDDEVLKGIDECIELAPLHNPDNLRSILAARKLFGDDVPQVAVFDTAFHQSIPERAYLYAIPYDLYDDHRIRRYGFHGTSHRYVASRYRALHGLTQEQTNIITLHLGNGCSAAAIKAGVPIDTSMGMTPLEGLMMGTRSGDLDPAVVSFVARKERISASEVEVLLNTKSGLFGISGSTNDMRDLQKARSAGDRPAQLAIEMFCYRAKKYIGAYLAAMGGADAIVFTGGIGENSPDVRALICEEMEWAGLRIDVERNRAAVGREGKICTDESKLAAYVIPTDEELLIAHDAVRIVGGKLRPE